MLNTLAGIIASSGGAAATSYESISTTTVGAGGSAYIDFTSIPSTYQHLQLRVIQRSTYAATFVGTDLRFNSDTGANYAFHYVLGGGSSASAAGYSSMTAIDSATMPAASITSGVFGAAVIDILDYANTSKNKTVRVLGGVDTNGDGNIALWSGLWNSTSAITSIRYYAGAGNLAQYTQVALYGIKG